MEGASFCQTQLIVMTVQLYIQVTLMTTRVPLILMILIQRTQYLQQYLSWGLGALPTEQLGCVPQVVELGTPGVLHAGDVGL